MTASGMSSRRNAQQLSEFDTTTARTAGHVAGAADQRLESMLARVAVILVEWHTRADSFVTIRLEWITRKLCDACRDSKTRKALLGILEASPWLVNPMRLSGKGVGRCTMFLCLRPLTRAEVRRLDVQAVEELAMPTLLLMENAGHGAANRLAELIERVIPPDTGSGPVTDSQLPAIPDRPRGQLSQSVLILCGPGGVMAGMVGWLRGIWMRGAFPSA